METKLPAFIPKTWDLPEAIRKRLGDQAGRQRVMDEDGHLLIILHAPPRPEDEEARTAAVFWQNAGGEWKSYPAGGGLSALQALLAAYRTMIGDLDDRADLAKHPREYFEVVRAVNPLLRSARNLLAAMEEARKERPDERRLIILRDEAVELERGIELLANDAKAGMEFALAESGEHQAVEARLANREARRLNQLVAFFFPLATLVAVFSINEPAQVLRTNGFWTVLAAGVVLGWLVRTFVGRSHRGA